jgi:two-component system LytT family response regulator
MMSDEFETRFITHHSSFIIPMPLRTLPRSLLIVLGWTGVALVAMIEAGIRARVLGAPSIVLAMLNEIVIIPLWLLVTPLLFRALERWPLTWRNALVYLGAGFAFVVASNALICLPLYFRGEQYVRRVTLALTIFLPGAMLAWSALTGIGVWLAHTPPAAVADAAPPSAAPPPPTHLVIADGAKTLRIALETIEWIEAEDNYALIHTPDRSHTVRQKLSALESQLDARRFVRVHRSAIVNVSRVSAVRPLTHGDFELVLERGTIVRGSRSRRAALELLRSA